MVFRKIAAFWVKYENLGLKITFILIALQIIHLYWLTSDVVVQRLFGESFFIVPDDYLIIFVIVDYLEIPALIAGITFYSLRIYSRKGTSRNVLFLILLASQIFHIFWLTDEIVYELFFDSSLVDIPVYVAWVAILIDYLELPVMVDLFYRIIRGKSVKK